MYGLGLLGARAATAAPLIAEHLASNDKEVVLEALRALRWLGRRGVAVTEPLKALQDHQDDEIQRYAMRFLAEITGDQGYRDLIRNRHGVTWYGETAYDDIIYRQPSRYTISFRN